MNRTHTRAGVRIQYSNALLAGAVLEKALLGAVVGRAGQPGQINQDGDLLGRVLEGLWGQVEVEGHFAFGGGGGMAELEQLAAEGGNGGLGGDRHGGWGMREGGSEVGWKGKRA